MKPAFKPTVVEGKLEELSEEQRKKLRQERFSHGHTSIAEAHRHMLDEQQKKLERANRFGLSIPELEKEKKEARAKRFGIETKESLEAKKLERMRRFGLDVKPKGRANNNSDLVLGRGDPQENSALAELRAKRLARFGEVAPEDAKPAPLKGSQRRRDRKMKRKQQENSAAAGKGQGQQTQKKFKGGNKFRQFRKQKQQ